MPRAGRGGVDRGAVRDGGVDPDRCDSAVGPDAEPRGDRTAQPRERDGGAARRRRGRRAAGPAPGGLRPERPDDAAAALDLGWLWPTLRTRGRAARAAGGTRSVRRHRRGEGVRRRSRRAEGAPAARIAGGWDEYVDAAVDAGRDAPPVLTRTELAARYETPAAQHLAREADRAMFSGSAPSESDAVAFWRIVDQERRLLLRERGAGRGILATVSLRSIVRSPAPSGSGSRSGERGSAGTPRPRTSP